MATVNNNLTRINDAEGTVTTIGIGGGQGATANTDIYLQGAQSAGRRITDTGTGGGFLIVDDVNNDCSAADVHVGMWMWVTHYSILNLVQIYFNSATTLTNYDIHSFPFSTEYPASGGWVRVWVDVSRTPNVTGGTGLNESTLRSLGAAVAFSQTPGGNAQNLCIDSSDFTNGGAALTLTGTTGLWSDFSTADQNATNQYGVFRRVSGVYNCFARVQLGSASSLAFSDENFTIIFPRQELVSDTFMGITVNLSNALTNVVFNNGAISSANSVKRGNLEVTGSLGTLQVNNSTLSNLRNIALTSGATLNGCLISGCGTITLGSGVITSSTVINSFASVALDVGGSANNVTNTSFTSAGTGHAIQITQPGTYSFSNLEFYGYGATGTTNAAVYNSSGGAVTINVDGGITPTYLNSAGSTTTIQVAPAQVTLSGLKADSEVRAYVGTDPTSSTEIAGTESSGTSFTFQQTQNGQNGYIQIFHVEYIPITLPVTYTSSNVTIPIQQIPDRQYARGTIFAPS